MPLRLSLTLLLLSLGYTTMAQPDTVHQHYEVSGTANVYYHAMFNHDKVPGGAGSAPIAVNVKGQKYINVVYTAGTVSCFGAIDSTYFGADGGTYGYSTAISGAGAFSGISHKNRVMFLCGVFASEASGLDEPYDPDDYTGKENEPTYWPALNQVFFIGDGKTDDGTLQTFLVPNEAEVLYIGFADCLSGPPSSYGDNAGTLKITIALRHEKG